MSKAKKPIIYSGGGVINSGPKASEALREFVELTGFPITSFFVFKCNSEFSRKVFNVKLELAIKPFAEP